MNRSILIVICDFLLVSLLAFSTVDITQVSKEGAARPVKMELLTNQMDSGKDLAAVMRLALDEERKNRDQLLGELTRARTTASERDQEAKTLQLNLLSREQEAARLRQEETDLQQRYSSAQTSIQTLNRQIQASSTEAQVSKEKLAGMEADARRQVEQATTLQQQLAMLEKSNQVAAAEQQRLSNQLQVAEIEKRHADELAARMQDEVKVEREEKARLNQQNEKLAEGVKALANNSGELAHEIHDNRPLAPNTIFNEFVTNRVQASFDAAASGLFGLDASKRKETQTLLVSNGTNTFALCHVQETPLTLWNPGREWQGLRGTLSHNGTPVPIHSLSFLSSDPRVVYMPVTDADARQLGCKVYRTSADPFKFQDAVLVNGTEGYYGECKFEIDLSAPDYVKLDRSFIKGLFGKFNPSRGDLVFSKTGELLGVMANGTYCVRIQSFEPAATFHFGSDVRDQHTGQILSLLYGQVMGLPFKLQ
jgi:hypothetical protein